MNQPKKTFNQLSKAQKANVIYLKIKLYDGTIFQAPSDPNYAQKYPTHFFAQNMKDDESSVKILKSMTDSLGADIFNKNDNNGRNLLLLAIGTSKLNTLEMMMASGADPARFSRKLHVTPIGYAAYEGFYQALAIMLKHGGDPFLKMEDTDRFIPPIRNSTLLHRLSRMSRNNLQEVIKVLLPYYPDLTLKTGEGKTIIDMLMASPLNETLITTELKHRAQKTQQRLQEIIIIENIKYKPNTKI